MKQTEIKQTSTEISNIQKDEEHNYESGEERSLIGLNEKHLVTKSNLTDLDLVTDCTLDSLAKPSFVIVKSLAKVASFGNKETADQMEQTFKPAAKCANQTIEKLEPASGFYKSNTYLKMSSQAKHQSSFNTISVASNRDPHLTPYVVPQSFRSIKVDQNHNEQPRMHKQGSICSTTKIISSKSN